MNKETDLIYIRGLVSEIKAILLEYSYKLQTLDDYDLNIGGAIVLSFTKDFIQVIMITFPTDITEIIFKIRSNKVFSIMMYDIKTSIFCKALITLNIYEHEKIKKAYNMD